MQMISSFAAGAAIGDSLPEFLGYRIGRNYRRDTGPVRPEGRKISGEVWLLDEDVYYTGGRAYQAVDAHARWRDKVRAGSTCGSDMWLVLLSCPPWQRTIGCGKTARPVRAMVKTEAPACESRRHLFHTCSQLYQERA